MLSSLENSVRKVVDSFVAQSILFTALDVSNEVKKTDPVARHKTVRDIVRSCFADIQNSGYTRTPIQVTLSDGTQVDALLYHPLSDSWDLDGKYDTQKRAQISSVGVSVPVQNLSYNTQPQQTSLPNNNPKQLWNNLFGGVKLFPRK